MKESSPSAQMYFNEEVESIVVGSILSYPELIHSALGKITANMFEIADYQLIFNNCLQMEKENIPIDLMSVVQFMTRNSTISKITQGAVTIAELTNITSNPLHFNNHVQILLDNYVSRAARQIFSDAALNLVQGNHPLDVISKAKKQLDELEDGSVNTSGLIHLSSYIEQSISKAYQRKADRDKGIMPGITTGLKDLDKYFKGWQNGELHIIAARPAMGKTAFALKFAKSAANFGKSVAIFSLEMTGERLTDRILLSETNVEAWRYSSGIIDNQELNSIEKAAGSIFDLPIYIDDNSNATISRIKAKSRVLSKKGKCDMVVIDYLQLTDGDEKSGNREQEIASITRGAKKMAKDLNIPVIMLSQLSRMVETRTVKRPMLSDLRESGAIEQDADTVTFIYRAEYYKDGAGDPLILYDYKGNPIEHGIELIIAKHRNGETGSVFVQHDGTLNKIHDYESTPF